MKPQSVRRVSGLREHQLIEPLEKLGCLRIEQAETRIIRDEILPELPCGKVFESEYLIMQPRDSAEVQFKQTVRPARQCTRAYASNSRNVIQPL